MTNRLRSILRDLAKLAASDAPAAERAREAAHLLKLIDDTFVTDDKIKALRARSDLSMYESRNLLEALDGDLAVALARYPKGGG